MGYRQPGGTIYTHHVAMSNLFSSNRIFCIDISYGVAYTYAQQSYGGPMQKKCNLSLPIEPALLKRIQLEVKRTGLSRADVVRMALRSVFCTAPVRKGAQ